MHISTLLFACSRTIKPRALGLLLLPLYFVLLPFFFSFFPQRVVIIGLRLPHSLRHDILPLWDRRNKRLIGIIITTTTAIIIASHAGSHEDFPFHFVDAYRDRESDSPVHSAPKAKRETLYRSQIFSPSWMAVSITPNESPNLSLFSDFFSRVLVVRRILTLSERMPPYSRHHKYSKKIECRHRRQKKKKIPDFCWN